MRTWLKKNLSKIAAIIVSLTVIAIVVDAVQHYAVLKFTEGWLQSCERRQNTFEAKLNLLPLGNASVDILNLVSKEDDEILTVKKIHLRKGIFDFNHFNLTAEEIVAPFLSAQMLRAVGQRTTNETGPTLTFNPITISNLEVAAPLVALKAQNVLADAVYKEGDSILTLIVTAPKIAVNQNEALGLQIFGNLTMHPPHNGELTFKVKGIEEFADIVIQSGYLDPNKGQILKVGGLLLGDEEGNVRLKLRFKNNNIFLGPLKIR
ncbi:DUF2125 domain-containing protein [Candidatus Paracaedibacter symbiosus]|uniref:DUF2125 domain-containing protein n=1 Tax=Candidatus Paracaedibacter symbiosus TaxID=244582 RepID=UPI0005099F7A|nr:DUF2125 domain-containing protein [Candidatus Paracaedibacter symbiosus]